MKHIASLPGYKHSWRNTFGLNVLQEGARTAIDNQTFRFLVSLFDSDQLQNYDYYLRYDSVEQRAILVEYGFNLHLLS